MFDLEYELKNLPNKPGVYLMKNSFKDIIYIGKAKVLKNRVRQYFQQNKNHSEKVKAMIKNIYEFEYIITDSEFEALILECNLIKKYRPKYNILLKDDKHYPFIKITMQDEFPQIISTRRFVKDGSKYFGPYLNTNITKEIVELIKKIFPIRTCKKNIKLEKRNSRPCLNYHINLCKAPCAGYISKKEYKDVINHVVNLLSGKEKGILSNLKIKMNMAAEKLEFEKASILRDKINIINKIKDKQKIILNNFENEDYLNVYIDDKDSCIQVFFLRDGKIVGREHFIIENTFNLDIGSLISDFIKEFYGNNTLIPKKIYVPQIDDIQLLQEWLSMKKENKVEIKVPKKGEKKDILNLVYNNAKLTLETFKQKYEYEKFLNENILKNFKNILQLECELERIESFDISNIQGVDSVGSMVVFENGKAKPSEYRRFKINTVIGANDYDSIREVLERRFKRGLSEIKSITNKDISFSAGKFCVFPDLILIDGGVGQVNIVLDVLKQFKINIPVCGMVKDSKHRTRGIVYQNVELNLKDYPDVMNFITRVQDEVHRFAISYHRSLRNKNSITSILDEIKGIGQKRKKALLLNFKTIENLKNATYDDLISIDVINEKVANNIIEYFKMKSF